MMQNSLYNILTLHVYTSLIEIGTFKSTTSSDTFAFKSISISCTFECIFIRDA